MLLSSFFRSCLVLFHLLFIGISVNAQQSVNRIVESKKVFVCTMERDTFKTAEEGCRHWAEKHSPGYTFQKVDTVIENGAVKCICTKAGEPDDDQQGKIYGIVICPELATEIIDETHFYKKKCECPTPGYEAVNNKCVPIKSKPAKAKN